jgi:hypothetical protein
MSKYDRLWEHVRQNNSASFTMSFDEIATAAGIVIDHSFLRYKKELLDYGFEVGKISLKGKTVTFTKRG